MRGLRTGAGGVPAVLVGDQKEPGAEHAELPLCNAHRATYLAERGARRCTMDGCEHLAVAGQQRVRLCRQHLEEKENLERTKRTPLAPG